MSDRPEDDVMGNIPDNFRNNWKPVNSDIFVFQMICAPRKLPDKAYM